MSQRLNFTKSALEAIQPPTEPGQRATYRDTKIDGLELRVTHTSVKTFSVYRWIPGQAKPDRITLGRFPDLSVEQARKKASEHIAAILSGVNPADAKRAARAEMTFGELFDLFMERHSSVHKRTQGGDRDSFRLYLSNRNFGPNLAGMRLSAIKPGHLAELHSKIGLQYPIAANRTLALVSSVFGRAIEWGLYDKLNPAKGVKKFKETSRERFLQKNELPRFFAALEQETNPLLRDFFTVCLLTGARRGNVQSMRWADLDLENQVWTVPAQRSKNARPMHVMLVDEAVQILKARAAASSRNPDYVFGGSGKRGFFTTPRKGWGRLLDTDELSQLVAKLDAAGHPFKREHAELLPSALARARLAAQKLQLDCTGTRLADLRIHDLRRTLGAWQAKQGASTLIIGQSLGHLSPASTQVYARLDRDPVRESVALATNAILGAAGQSNHRSEGRDPSDGAGGS